MSDPAYARISQGFFKTGKGEYGEGDVFLGIKSGPLHILANESYKKISIGEAVKLLRNKIHEARMVALRILINKYRKGCEEERKKIYKIFLDNTGYINNWDLVDISVHKVIGEYLLDKDRKILYELARSKNLWERRIAMISSFAFIRKKDFSDTLKLAEILLNDKHDLIHKAVGWALREVGNKDRKAEEVFLKKHYKKMPRTMLRYAIEKFDEKARRFYMER